MDPQEEDARPPDRTFAPFGNATPVVLDDTRRHAFWWTVGTAATVAVVAGLAKLLSRRS